MADGEYRLPNTGDQVAAAIARALSIVVPTHTSQLQNDSGFVTAADVPTKTSQLQNDSGFVLSSDLTTETTRAMTEEARLAGLIASVSAALANYYTKSETYNKTEVNNLIGAIQQFHYEIYPSLASVTNPQSNVLYLIGPTGSGSDKYEEYVYANSTWTKIGDTTIDLSGYPTTEEVEAMLNSLWSDVLAELNKKANKDGWYEQMAVGLAENLVDTKGEGTEQEFNFRPSCDDVSLTDDGSAVIKEVQGQTKKWNQLINATTSTFNECTLTLNANGSYTLTGTPPAARYKTMSAAPNTAGHKLLLVYKLVSGSSLAIYDGNNVNAAGSYHNDSFSLIYAPTNNATITLLRFANATQDAVFYLRLFDLTAIYGAGDEPTTVEQFLADHPYALEAGYGAGDLLSNKITAIETDGFNQWDEVAEIGSIDANGNNVALTDRLRSKNYMPVFPNTAYYFKTPRALGVYWYDINKAFISSGAANNATLTAPANAYYLRFYIVPAYGTTYKNDICINLSHGGYHNGEYEPYWKRSLNLNIPEIKGVVDGGSTSEDIFPNGLHGAGSVFDKLRRTDADVVLGEVDLGTLSGWVLRNGTTNVFQLNNPNVLYAILGSANNNVCSHYSVVMVGSGASVESGPDKYVYLYRNTQAPNERVIYIKDTKITSSDIVSGKIAKLNGVKLVYQLATPKHYTLEEPLNLTYKVADFGTERAVPSTEVDPITKQPLSAPFKAVIKYNNDFTREIVNLPKNYVPRSEVEEELDKKANKEGEAPLLISGAAKSLIAKELSDAVISYRATPSGTGVASIAKIKGRTDVWNQKVDTVTAYDNNGITITVGANGYLKINGTATANIQAPILSGMLVDLRGHTVIMGSSKSLPTNASWSLNYDETKRGYSRLAISSSASGYLYLNIGAGVSFNNEEYYFQIFDLTLQYGAGREPATAAAFLAEYPEALFAPYNAGKLINNKVTALVTDGFNQWDEQWEVGGINANGVNDDSFSDRWRSVGFIPVINNISYYARKGATNYVLYIYEYDANKAFIRYEAISGIGGLFVPSPDVHYIRISPGAGYGVTYKNDIAINLSHSGIRDGEYEPYWTSTLNIVHSKIYGKLEGAGEMVQVAPNGFRGVGSNCDEVDIVRKEAYIRRSWVDMGTLSYYVVSTGQGMFQCGKPGAAAAGSVEIKGSKYSYLPNLGYSVTDKTISDSVESSYTRVWMMKDTALANKTATEIAAALSGEYVDYPLATPLHYTDLMYSEDGGQTFVELPSNYRVDDFGTERRLPDGLVDGAPASTPLVALINYPIDLPKTYQNQDSMDDLLNKLASAFGFTWSKTWDGVKYVYTITNNS